MLLLNAASNISYRSLLEVDVFTDLFMNELKNFANVVIGKLGKNCSHDFLTIALLGYFCTSDKVCQ
jgi:hypothetical protein